MAHIPYGYRIEKGKAVIVPEEAEQIHTFMTGYLDGLSIQSAGAVANLPFKNLALRKMLDNAVYLGTDYYPRIIDPSLFEAVQRDRAARTHPGNTRPAPVIPVRCRFTMNPPDHPDAGWMSAKEIADYLYSQIQPDEKGHPDMTVEEKNAVTAWRLQVQTAIG